MLLGMNALDTIPKELYHIFEFSELSVNYI